MSLFPICSKIYERLLYNERFGFFLDKGLISVNQSGFKPGDSYINQLLSITHNIYKSFEDGYEVRGVFLDISKIFFSEKLKKTCHSPLCFNNNNVFLASSQKHQELTLTFNEHLRNVSNKTIWLLWKLQSILPRPALLTKYKCFIRP